MLPKIFGRRRAMTDVIRCPVCHGAGEARSEARLYVRGMNRWTEYGCRACFARGYTTTEQLRCYQANRRNDNERIELFHERRKRQEAAA